MLTLDGVILPSATTFTKLVVDTSAMTINSKRNPLELNMSVAQQILSEFHNDPASVFYSQALVTTSPSVVYRSKATDCFKLMVDLSGAVHCLSLKPCVCTREHS